jgi:hypothetical protein
MWPFLRNISPGPSNFEMVNTFCRGFTTGIRASNWDQTCSATDLTKFGSHIALGWHVAIFAKYFAGASQFRNGRFLSSRLWHWDQSLRSGSDMLHHNHLTEFESHIVPFIMECGHCCKIFCHSLGILSILAKYLAGAWQFGNGQFLAPRLQHLDHGLKLESDMLHHTDLTQFGSHILP